MAFVVDEVTGVVNAIRREEFALACHFAIMEVTDEEAAVGEGLGASAIHFSVFPGSGVGALFLEDEGSLARDEAVLESAGVEGPACPCFGQSVLVAGPQHLQQFAWAIRIAVLPLALVLVTGWTRVQPLPILHPVLPHPFVPRPIWPDLYSIPLFDLADPVASISNSIIQLLQRPPDLLSCRFDPSDLHNSIIHLTLLPPDVILSLHPVPPDRQGLIICVSQRVAVVNRTAHVLHIRSRCNCSLVKCLVPRLRRALGEQREIGGGLLLIAGSGSQVENNFVLVLAFFGTAGLVSHCFISQIKLFYFIIKRKK